MSHSCMHAAPDEHTVLRQTTVPSLQFACLFSAQLLHLNLVLVAAILTGRDIRNKYTKLAVWASEAAA